MREKQESRTAPIHDKHEKNRAEKLGNANRPTGAKLE